MWSTAMSVSFPFHQLQPSGRRMRSWRCPGPGQGDPKASRGLHLQPPLPIAMPFRKKILHWLSFSIPTSNSALEKKYFLPLLVLYLLRFICKYLHALSFRSASILVSARRHRGRAGDQKVRLRRSQARRPPRSSSPPATTARSLSG